MVRTADIDRLSDDQLVVELDGAGISPQTVDAALLVRLAAAYVELVQKISESDERLIELRGIEVIDKCAALALHVTKDRDAVVADFKRAQAYIAGTYVPLRGLEGPVDRVHGVLTEIPEGQVARVAARGWVERLAAPDRLEAPLARATTTIRVTLVRLGNVTWPKAGFVSAAQDRTFSLDVDMKTAKALAKHLYENMDITAAVRYDERLNICGGQLLRYYPVDAEVDPLAALTAWFAAQEPDDAEPEEWVP